MKTMVILFERNTYQSNSDGSARTWVSRDDLRQKLGQAKSIRVQIIGYRNIANTGVKLKMYENSYYDLRPSETNASGAPFWTGTEALDRHRGDDPAPRTRDDHRAVWRERRVHFGDSEHVRGVSGRIRWDHRADADHGGVRHVCRVARL